MEASMRALSGGVPGDWLAPVIKGGTGVPGAALLACLDSALAAEDIAEALRLRLEAGSSLP